MLENLESASAFNHIRIHGFAFLLLIQELQQSQQPQLFQSLEMSLPWDSASAANRCEFSDSYFWIGLSTSAANQCEFTDPH